MFTDSIARWNTAVDYKWRLAIPSELLSRVGKNVMISENPKDGCVQIYPLRANKAPSLFVHEVKSGGRVLIPRSLRESTSFFFGRKVTIVAKNSGAIELHPRK
jgi:DNA-binding transcriptional regulator/RsmH inhibitor MraZ